MDEPEDQLSVERHDLFSIPIWTFDLEPFFGHVRAGMIVDAEIAVEEAAAEDAPYAQSRAVLQEFPNQPWPFYHSWIANLAGRILDSNWPTAGYRPGHLASWVLRIGGCDPCDGGAARHLHSHPRATLSAVLYLQVPPELEGERGGTVFKDPNSGPNGYMAGRPWYRIPATPMQLVMFPSWLEHAPDQPDRTMSYSIPRLVIATDVVCF